MVLNECYQKLYTMVLQKQVALQQLHSLLTSARYGIKHAQLSRTSALHTRSTKVKSTKCKKQKSHRLGLPSNPNCSHQTPSLLLYNQHGPIIKSLLQRTYRILNDSKDHKLGKRISSAAQESFKLEPYNSDHEFNKNPITEESCHGQISPTSGKIQNLVEMMMNSRSKISVDIQPSGSKLTPQEQFSQKMYYKYQFPLDQEAKLLSEKIPNFRELVYEVCEPWIEGGVLSSHKPILSSHLGGLYWKATITLNWPMPTSDTSSHPVQDVAIDRAYLLCCIKLMNFGLIYKSNNGRWCPVTHDMVLEWLDLIAHYGSKTVGSSRGRGFKMHLEQVKEINNMEKVRLQQLRNSHDSYQGEKLYSRESISADQSVELDQEKINIPTVDKKCPLNGMSVLEEDPKLKWRCTMHVGWPRPFSLEVEALSLPAAQRLGCLAVANKLKTQKLLRNTNCGLSITKLEFCVVRETIQQWEKNLPDQFEGLQQKFKSPDAEIFCDASVKGFGAYLIRRENSKVSWMSESWNDHQQIWEKLLKESNGHLISTLAEMFATVTAVFTWKSKLRHNRLLIFSDNMTVVSLLNTLHSTPISREHCTTHYDHLVWLYQFACSQYSITAHCVWLDRARNKLADCLSRQNHSHFRSAVPNAACFQTKAKKLKIRSCSI